MGSKEARRALCGVVTALHDVTLQCVIALWQLPLEPVRASDKQPDATTSNTAARSGSQWHACGLGYALGGKSVRRPHVCRKAC